MPLVGERLGPYEIVAAVGAGGMGEVWRARDTRLGRDVAIKVLPSALADSAAALRRMEQESRTIAGLNHPNLVAIYDVGTHAGRPYLVMELLDGETLRERLARAPLGLRRALDYARQVAQGLAAAHGAGIVHRDLKPANVMITASGRVKILDFGLAKAAAAPAADADTMAATALDAPATAAGTVLGTVGYMAPEQVRGEPAGTAADIFAFGAVLYEMLAGRRAFQAPSGVETMAAILNQDPPELAAPSGAPALPPTLDRIVRRCLEKSAGQRFQSAADLDFALSAVTEASSTTHSSVGATAPLTARRRGWRWRQPATAAVSVAVAVALCLLFTLDRAVPTIPTTSMRALDLNALHTGVMWSPDGKELAYAAAPVYGEPYQAYIYFSGQSVPQQLTREAAMVMPVGWSADGHNLMFIEDPDVAPKLYSVAAVGGAPRLLGALGHPAGGVQAASLFGDTLAVVVPGSDGKITVGYSQPLGTPLRWYAPEPFAVDGLQDFPTLEFSPDGSQLFLSLPTDQGPINNWLLPFPPRAGAPPRAVLTDLPPHDYSPKFSWMPDGRHLLLSTSVAAGGGSLWEVEPVSGNMQPLAEHLPGGYFATLAPNGTALALLRELFDINVVSASVQNAAITPLLASTHNEDMPAWAADAPALVYVTDRDGSEEVWLHEAAADATGDRMLVNAAQMGAPGFFDLPALSPHAHRVAYTFSNTAGGARGQTARLYLSAVAGGAPVPLTGPSSDVQYAPAWSPNGNQIAYLGSDGPLYKLMLVATTGGAAPQVLNAVVGRGGMLDTTGPAWSRDGRWIAFLATDGLVHIVAPNGSGERVASRTPLTAWAFSADSRLLYGITEHGGTAELVQVALAGGNTRPIGSLGGNLLAAPLVPGYHLTLALDGNSVTYNTGDYTHELDLVAPYSISGGMVARLRRWLRIK